MRAAPHAPHPKKTNNDPAVATAAPEAAGAARHHHCNQSMVGEATSYAPMLQGARNYPLPPLPTHTLRRRATFKHNLSSDMLRCLAGPAREPRQRPVPSSARRGRCSSADEQMRQCLGGCGRGTAPFCQGCSTRAAGHSGQACRGAGRRHHTAWHVPLSTTADTEARRGHRRRHARRRCRTVRQPNTRSRQFV